MKKAAKIAMYRARSRLRRLTRYKAIGTGGTLTLK